MALVVLQIPLKIDQDQCSRSLKHANNHYMRNINFTLGSFINHNTNIYSNLLKIQNGPLSMVDE